MRVTGLSHLLQLHDTGSKELLCHAASSLDLLNHNLNRGKGAGVQQAPGLYQALQAIAPQLAHCVRRAEQDLLVCLL